MSTGVSSRNGALCFDGASSLGPLTAHSSVDLVQASSFVSFYPLDPPPSFSPPTNLPTPGRDGGLVLDSSSAIDGDVLDHEPPP